MSPASYSCTWYVFNAHVALCLAVDLVFARLLLLVFQHKLTREKVLLNHQRAELDPAALAYASAPSPVAAVASSSSPVAWSSSSPVASSSSSPVAAGFHRMASLAAAPTVVAFKLSRRLSLAAAAVIHDHDHDTLHSSPHEADHHERVHADADADVELTAFGRQLSRSAAPASSLRPYVPNRATLPLPLGAGHRRASVFRLSSSLLAAPSTWYVDHVYLTGGGCVGAAALLLAALHVTSKQEEEKRE